jgi:hypothetical protein
MFQRYNQALSLRDLQLLNDCWLLKQLLSFQLEREALPKQCLEHHLASIDSNDRSFSGLSKIYTHGDIYATNQTISPATL